MGMAEGMGKKGGGNSFISTTDFKQAELMRRAYQRHRPTERTTSCSEKKE